MLHTFDSSIATKYGLDVSIFFNQLSGLIQLSEISKEHFYDGKYWTDYSVIYFKQLFPYWSIRKIQSIIDKCLNEKLIEICIVDTRFFCTISKLNVI